MRSWSTPDIVLLASGTAPAMAGSVSAIDEGDCEAYNQGDPFYTLPCTDTRIVNNSYENDAPGSGAVSS